MTEEIFYCECPRCSVHNKRRKHLHTGWSSSKNAELVFGEDFTPEKLLDRLKRDVTRLNYSYRGKDIEVTMMRFGGTITYSFKDDTNSDASLGSMSLHPIATTIYNINNI